jgi:hypothetical protein
MHVRIPENVHQVTHTHTHTNTHTHTHKHTHTHTHTHGREPPIEDPEKATIREALPAALSDPNTKIRTAVAMAVAGIAAWDCPQAWPALLPGLVGAIAARQDANLGGWGWREGGGAVEGGGEGRKGGAGKVN